MSACRRIQVDQDLSHYTKLKPKCIKVLNIKTDSLNLIEKKVRNNFQSIDTGGNLLNRTPDMQALRSQLIYETLKN